LISLQPTPTTALEPTFLAAFRSGTLTESQAEVFLDRDPLELKFLLLQLSAAFAVIAMSAGPHAPSSAWPPGSKPSPKARPKKPGAKPGAKTLRRRPGCATRTSYSG